VFAAMMAMGRARMLRGALPHRQGGGESGHLPTERGDLVLMPFVIGGYPDKGTSQLGFVGGEGIGSPRGKGGDVTRGRRRGEAEASEPGGEVPFEEQGELERVRPGEGLGQLQNAMVRLVLAGRSGPAGRAVAVLDVLAPGLARADRDLAEAGAP